MNSREGKIGFVIILFCFLSLLGAVYLQAAVEVKIVKIILLDESELIGTILTEESTVIMFRTMSGVDMTISRDKIKSIEPMELIGGKALRTDPNETRLFLAPTARPLKPFQGYFSVYEIFLPYFAIGVTDFFALGGGMSLLPGATEQLVYFAPKVTPFHAANIDLAAGVLYMTSTGGVTEGIGVIYGLGTFGKKTLSLTGGLGWGFSGEGIASHPILMVGAEAQLSNSVKLLTENWIPVGSDIVFLSFGVRFIGRNLAADLGFIHPAGLGLHLKGFPFFPWLGFSYNFGKIK